jgi:hypothetical protein
MRKKIMLTTNLTLGFDVYTEAYFVEFCGKRKYYPGYGYRSMQGEISYIQSGLQNYHNIHVNVVYNVLGEPNPDPVIYSGEPLKVEYCPEFCLFRGVVPAGWHTREYSRYEGKIGDASYFLAALAGNARGPYIVALDTSNIAELKAKEPHIHKEMKSILRAYIKPISLLRLFKEIKANPTCSDLNEKLTKAYEAMYMFGRKKQPKDIIYKGILETLNFVTGIKYEKVRDNREWTISHPDNIKKVHIGDENSPQEKVSKAYFDSQAFTCPHCNNNFYARNYGARIDLDTRRYVCNSCVITEAYTRCSNCDNTYHPSNQGCPRYSRNSPSTIYNYSQDVRGLIPTMYNMPYEKPREVPITGTNKIAKEFLRYGVELEVQVKEDISFDAAAEATGVALRNYAIMKRDSSIGPSGFEIVTVPATLEFHKKEMWKRFFGAKDYNGKSASELLKSWGTKCCGIHVHITRAAMLPMQLSKLLVFYHDENNGGFLTKIAGRFVGEGARYCNMDKKRLSSNTSRECGNHHYAITISERNNGKTAEVRIFRGNCSRHGLMRCLEFVDATVQWCGEASGSELNYKSFLAWFNRPSIRGNYPDLWRHLIQLGYLTTSHNMKPKKITKSKRNKMFITLTDAERTA